MTNNSIMEIVKAEISNALPATGEIAFESQIPITRKWFDGGVVLFELVHPQLKKQFWLSVLWFVELDNKTFLVADEFDRTVDPAYLRQFLIRLVDFDTVQTLSDDEFEQLLPRIKEIVNGSTSIPGQEWRQRYNEDTTRFLNII